MSKKALKAKEDSPQLLAQKDSFLLQGEWVLNKASAVIATLATIKNAQNKETITFDASQLLALDSTGAYLLNQWVTQQSTKIEWQNLAPKFEGLLTLVADQANKENVQPPKKLKLLAQLGFEAIAKYHEAKAFLTFIGELVYTIGQVIAQPKQIVIPSVVEMIEKTGLRALPIIGLLSFLIGMVLSYQMGVQLKTYGANVFIVGITGIAILREFAPLITAIIVAGRTSSSFTAQLGIMKVNEEIDALQTLGISPIARLILPKILALLIVFPLLIVWADIFGVLGAMVMAKGQLGIGFLDFLHRFKTDVDPEYFQIGLWKAPVFALLIATVGCYQGLRVAANADSIGTQTTKSVVQAIFLIIIADAIYSIFFSLQGF